jgi:TP901 family phage tail tape measure protein
LAEAIVAISADDSMLVGQLASIQGYVRNQAAAMAGILGSLGVGLFAKTAGESETALAHLRGTFSTTYKDATTLNMVMGVMTQTVRDLGTSSMFGAGEIAREMQTLASMGMNANEVMTAIKPVMDLAAATETKLADTAKIVGQQILQQGLAFSDAGKLADVLAAASTRSGQSLEALGRSASYVGDMAHRAGLSMEDTVATLTLLSQHSQQGSRAGTGLLLILRSLADNASSKKFKDSGIEVLEKGTNRLKPLADIVDEIQNKLSKLSDAGKQAALDKIFPARAAAGISVLFTEGGAGLRQLSDMLRNSAGSARQMAEAMESSLGGAFRMLRASFQTFISDVGSRLTFIPMLMNAFRGLVRVFVGLPDSVKNSAVGFAEMFAVLGVGRVILPRLVGLLGILGQTFTGPFNAAYTVVSRVVGGVGQVVAGVGRFGSGAVTGSLGLVAGFFRLMRGELELLRDGFLVAAGGVGRFLWGLLQVRNAYSIYGTAAMISPLGALSKAFGKTAMAALYLGYTVLSSAPRIIAGLVQLSVGAVGSLASTAAAAVRAGVYMYQFASPLSRIPRLFQAMGAAAGSVFGSMLGVIMPWRRAWFGVSSTMSLVFDGVYNLATGISNVIMGIVRGVIPRLLSAMFQIGLAAVRSVTSLLGGIPMVISGFKNMASGITWAATGLTAMGVSGVQMLWKLVNPVEVLKSSFSGLTTIIQTGFSVAGTALGIFSGGLLAVGVGALLAFGAAFAAAFQDKGTGPQMKSDLLGILDEIMGIVSALFGVEQAGGAWQAMKDMAVNALATVHGWISEHRDAIFGVASAIKDTLVAAWDYAVSAVSMLWDKVMEFFAWVAATLPVNQEEWTTWASSILQIVQNTFKFFYDIGSAVFGAVGALFGWLADVSGVTWADIKKWFTDFFDTFAFLTNDMKKTWEMLTTWMALKWSELMDADYNVWQSIKGYAQGAWDALKAGTDAVINNLKNLWSNFKAFMVALWEGIKAAAKAGLQFGGKEGVTLSFEKAFDASLKEAQKKIPAMKNIGTEMKKAWDEGIKKHPLLVGDSDETKTLKNDLNKIVTEMEAIHKKAKAGATDTVTNAMQNVRKMLSLPDKPTTALPPPPARGARDDKSTGTDTAAKVEKASFVGAQEMYKKIQEGLINSAKEVREREQAANVKRTAENTGNLVPKVDRMIDILDQNLRRGGAPAAFA